MSNLHPVVQIGDWYYQVIYGQLWPTSTPDNAEQMIRLEPRLHSLLNFFLQHPNTLLAKDTLIDNVWPADEGTDAAVMRAVGALRKVLGDDVRAPSFIATVSKKGYCWLAPIQPATMRDFQPGQDIGADNSPQVDETATAVQHGWSWRVIIATAAAVLLSCASLAFVLAKLTAAPLVKLPDTLSPISALSGQEYWPVLNAAQSQVLYQHRPPESHMFNWSVQNLQDLKVEHLPEHYQQLSQALWQDDQHIVFRGNTAEQGCYFYRQQLYPARNKPKQIAACNKMIAQGMARWGERWLWLDVSKQHQTQLWSGMPGADAKLLLSMPASWRKLEHILLRADTLYMLVQEAPHTSMLLKLDLPDGKPELISRFPYTVAQFSWWDDNQILLAPHQQQLQIFDLSSQTGQSLGPLTRELTQAMRYPGQVLATQYLNYTTDIYTAQTDTQQELTLQPWHVSNRSERLLAVSAEQQAFVSERAGHSQIWLAQGRDSAQLTKLYEEQQVQQLFWHQQHLLTLVNNQLYRVQPDTASLTLLPWQAKIPGRYASCNNNLYWTELTTAGWRLFTAANDDKLALYDNVVDVRCAPGQGLILQFAADTVLTLLAPDKKLTPLPVQINWHELSAEQWFADKTGIYWLDEQSPTVLSYLWETDNTTKLTLPLAQRPEAIYSNGAGLGYVVQPRPHDTDIVWLQNRR
jgi:DNA-binding winged helix-turn-helix (wHTH) protein